MYNVKVLIYAKGLLINIVRRTATTMQLHALRTLHGFSNVKIII